MIGQIRRIALDLAIAFIFLLIYASQLYQVLPAPLQLVSVKIFLVSMGFIHAHITRKLAFPSVNWEEEFNAKTLLIIALYCVIIYAYASGG